MENERGRQEVLMALQGVGRLGIMMDVPNLIYKLDGEIIQNVIQEFDINDTDLPDYRGINMDHYFSPEKIISVISSKGCHWAKCTFCTCLLYTSPSPRD